MATLFISYSRKDLEGALDLREKLKELGHEAWLDLGALPAASRWREEIARAIEQSDVFILALSPHSATSPECRKELDHALQLGKRLIPVVLRDVTPEAVDPRVAEINWIFLRLGEDPRVGLERLATAITMDLDHLHRHTRFLLRALEWEASHRRDHGPLLRGPSLLEAELWLAESGDKEPVPTALQRDFVTASRGAERQRRTLWSLVAVLILAISVTAMVVWSQRSQAARTALSRQLARDAKTSPDFESALLLAVAAHEAAASGDADDAILSGLEKIPQLQLLLHGHSHEVEALAFHPHAPVLASAGDDGAIHLWDTTSWKPKSSLPTGKERIAKLAFTPDGGALWSGDWAGRLRRWDLAQGKEITPSLDSGHGLVETFALHPGGRYVAAGYSNGAALWDLSQAPPRAVELPVTPDRRVPGVAFDAQGRRLAVIEGTESLVFWDFSNGTLSNRQERRLGTGITALAWKSGSETLALGLKDGTVVWLDTEGPAEPERREPGHDGQPVLQLAFNEDGSRLAAAGADKRVQVWSEGGKEPLLTLPMLNRVFAVAFQPGTPLLVSAGAEPTVYLWNTGLFQPLARPVLRRRSDLQKAVFTPDGRALWIGDLAGLLLRIDLVGGQVETIPVEDGDEISGLAVAGHRLLWSGARGLFGIWNLTENRGETFPRQLSPVSAVAMQTDGEAFATGREDGHVSAWRRKGATWEERPLPAEAPPGHPLGPIMDLAFSPDSRLLVAGDNEGRIRAWDADSLKIVHTWNVPIAAANLAFSPDGSQLAVANAGDGQITVLDPSRQEVPKPFLAQGCRAFSVAFRRDGRLLSAGCDDGSLALFEAGTWRALERLRAYGEFVNALAASPTEDVMASATSDGRVLIWDLDELSWKRRACRRANRDLTRAIPGWNGLPPRGCASLLEGASPEPPGLPFDLAPDVSDELTRTVAQIGG